MVSPSKSSHSLHLSTHLTHILATDSGVDPNYQHIGKQVRVLDPLKPSGSALKWYSLYPADLAIPDDITNLARAYITRVQLEARGLGFVILHRCGAGFYFLIVCTWRGSNEVWETVFYKDGDAMKDFALFPRDGQHRPTFCVWELVPVWHEQQAWVRFLSSPRDENAAQAWFQDTYTGPA